jgi:hypothetical protein
MNEHGWYIEPYGFHNVRWISDEFQIGPLPDQEAEPGQAVSDGPIVDELEPSSKETAEVPTFYSRHTSNHPSPTSSRPRPRHSGNAN